MITLTSKSLVLILTEMGYYDFDHDTKIDSFFAKHNISFAINRGPFTLTFPTEQTEMFFRLTYATLL